VRDPDESLKWARVAAEQATLFGMLQTVASEGPEVVELIERVPWQAPPNWMDRLRRAALPAARASAGGAEWATLTDRERDVLRFLSSRLTLREIASELYVSLNTLKFHLKVIYRKLGVNSRADAAEIARQMSIRRET
jgi:LuxR family maltose regulon positive regulatory protein